MPTKTKRRKSSKPRMTNAEVYQMVTDRVLDALKQDIVPWQRPWKVQGGIHKNLATKRSYQGSNILLLDITALLDGYTSPWWLTFKQAKDLGGNVRKGESGTKITFWSMIEVGEKKYNEDTGRYEKDTIPMLKTWTVFNVEQTEGIDPKKIPTVEKQEEFTPIERAEKMFKAMPKRPRTVHGGDSACYRPLEDSVWMPRKKDFVSPEAYYATEAHELVHSTGHSSRLKRPEIVKYEEDKGSRFGDKDYSNEELVAELGASFVCAVLGIDSTKQQENSAAYLKTWIGRLEDDPKLIIGAGSKAQKAANYIMDVKEEN
jgi:antirestriction protein ArdC